MLWALPHRAVYLLSRLFRFVGRPNSLTLLRPPRPQVRVRRCNPSLFRFSIDHYDGTGKEWATVFKTVMLRRSAAAGNSQTFVPRAVLGLSSHSSRLADHGQAVGFRPAAIRGRARRTTLVRRSKLIQSPTSLLPFIPLKIACSRIPNTMFRKLLRLIFGDPKPPADDEAVSGGVEPSVESDPDLVDISHRPDGCVRFSGKAYCPARA